ncbi:hypothetical protein HCJ76_43985 [Streptomyces sp. MC1]|uniref:hypothetical protein n=1 Tax=Streptomyces sp. MC1 TaxID=295105 RepID=UPI0018C95AA7|nr:hypothetical protein [Streptomyces sp. MC1]MBG7704844.1 hypothetical protein [Streptomyces sp. MC1]
MTPSVKNAIQAWQGASDELQECAIEALCTALPGLGRSKTPPYCCPVTLHIGKPGDLGEGRVCIDTDTRATVEITDIPNDVVGQAVDAVFGEGWFDEAEGPLAEEDPGEFHYDDETTGAEWIVELGENGLGKVHIECVPVPFAAELLDSIAIARTEQQGAQPAAGTEEAGTLTA